jgi:hypothetical protein
MFQTGVADCTGIINLHYVLYYEPFENVFKVQFELYVKDCYWINAHQTKCHMVSEMKYIDRYNSRTCCNYALFSCTFVQRTHNKSG